jgi:RND family efflux transporter MFP subunit
MTITRKIVNLLVAPLVVVAAVLIAVQFIKTRKTRPPKKPPVVVARVAFTKISPETIIPVIKTYGNTRSFLTTTLASQVGGELLRIAPEFQAGRTIVKDQLLVEINPADYEAVLAERQSAAANARRALAEEQTRSQLATEDWIASGRKLADATGYTLRKPQLAAAEAAVEAAEAVVRKAELDLKRTRILSPFDAVVESRTASPGNIVTPGAPLGVLIARERLEVRLPLTPQQVNRLRLARAGTTDLTATLTTPTVPGATWEAAINRIEPAVDLKNQSLWIIGEVEEPFAKPEAFLPVGAFVNATINGAPLENVLRFPEVTVVEDAFVWTISPDNTLTKQAVEVVYSQDGMILVRIADPLFAFPLKVADRPLSSFKENQKVAPVDPDAPAAPPGTRPGGKGPGKGPGGNGPPGDRNPR